MNSTSNNLGGIFTFLGTSMNVRRMGYGAMQLAGPGVFGARRGRGFVRSNIDASGTSVAASALAECAADSWNIVCSAPARKPRRCRIDTAGGNTRQIERDQRRIETKNQRKDRRS